MGSYFFQLRKTPIIQPVLWPRPNWIKVNTDGAANGSPGPAGFGAVFRNYRGFPKGCFSVPLEVTHAYHSELFAVIKAVEIAYRHNWTNLWTECDLSYVVVALSKKDFMVPWSIRAQWKVMISRPS